MCEKYSTIVFFILTTTKLEIYASSASTCDIKNNTRGYNINNQTFKGPDHLKVN